MNSMFLGRWDVTVQGIHRNYASWFELTKELILSCFTIELGRINEFFTIIPFDIEQQSPITEFVTILVLKYLLKHLHLILIYLWKLLLYLNPLL